jgi:hypothetical protein
MLAMGLATVASNRFIDFCLAEFGPEGELISSELTQGFPNKALESGIALWELSREALARPKVAEALQRHGGESLSEALDSVDGGADFIELLTGFLAAFGNRSHSSTYRIPAGPSSRDLHLPSSAASLTHRKRTARQPGIRRPSEQGKPGYTKSREGSTAMRTSGSNSTRG